MTGLTRLTVIAAALLCLLSAVQVLAGDPEEAYNRGNKLYAEKKYEAAVELYNSIDTENPDLEYNRAAAYFKIGKTGKAALHFNRALRLRPGDADTLANLEYLKTINANREEPEKLGSIAKASTYAVNALSLQTMSFIAAFLYLATTFTGLGLIISLDPKRRSLIARYLLALLVVTTLWFSITGVRVHRFERTDRAIAVAINVDAYDSPSDQTATVFSMSEGTEVSLGRVEGNYVHVTLVSGYSGWVDRAKLERI